MYLIAAQTLLVFVLFTLYKYQIAAQILKVFELLLSLNKSQIAALVLNAFEIFKCQQVPNRCPNSKSF
jgi:hypothetical protein